MPILSKLKSATLLAMMLVSMGCWAQFSESINSDRPGLGIGAYTVGQRVLQVQSGINYRDIDDRRTQTDFLTSNTVMRYGLNERLEVNTSFTRGRIDRKIKGQETTSLYLSAAHLGFRYHLRDESAQWPAIAIEGRTLVNVSEYSPHVSLSSYDLTLITEHPLLERWLLVSNLTLSKSHTNTSFGGAYVFTANYSIADRWGAFAEVYGAVDAGTPSYDGGVTYLLSDNLLLDASYGYGGRSNRKDQFFDIGFSWRLVRN